MNSLETNIKRLGSELGFSSVGITSADDFTRDEHATIRRVKDGLMDGLPWFTEDRVRRANRPRELLPGARSVVSLAMSYQTGEPKLIGKGPHGRVARYAWGYDYHKVMKDRIKLFCNGLAKCTGRDVATRIFVDDGPMNDRAAAERSGIGWFGKNTNILNPTLGSWILIGNVITDLELKPDKPLAKNCGECVRCIDDCPTGAIVAPFVIDNRRCISFLTIELRGSIPRELRPMVGDWVFGCDICQDVCPVNIKATVTSEPAFLQRKDFAAPELLPLLEITDEEFGYRFKGSPIKRAKRKGLQRNVCVALGNIGDPIAIPSLSKVLIEGEPIIREHAAWALGCIGGEHALSALRSALGSEHDANIRQGIQMDLDDAAERSKCHQ